MKLPWQIVRDQHSPLLRPLQKFVQEPEGYAFQYAIVKFMVSSEQHRKLSRQKKLITRMQDRSWPWQFHGSRAALARKGGRPEAEAIIYVIAYIVEQ